MSYLSSLAWCLGTGITTFFMIVTLFIFLTSEGDHCKLETSLIVRYKRWHSPESEFVLVQTLFMLSYSSCSRY